MLREIHKKQMIKIFTRKNLQKEIEIIDSIQCLKRLDLKKDKRDFLNLGFSTLSDHHQYYLIYKIKKTRYHLMTDLKRISGKFPYVGSGKSKIVDMFYESKWIFNGRKQINLNPEQVLLSEHIPPEAKEEFLFHMNLFRN